MSSWGWKEKHYGVQPMQQRLRKDATVRERDLSRHRGRAVASRPRLVIEEESPHPRGDAQTGGGGVEISQYLITSEQADTVTSGQLIIAKPFPLRGAAGTRTVSGEILHIAPAYISAGFPVEVEPNILAAKVGAFVTGLPGVEWMALGDGRAWLRTG